MYVRCVDTYICRLKHEEYTIHQPAQRHARSHLKDKRKSVRDICLLFCDINVYVVEISPHTTCKWRPFFLLEDARASCPLVMSRAFDLFLCMVMFVYVSPEQKYVCVWRGVGKGGNLS